MVCLYHRLGKQKKEVVFLLLVVINFMSVPLPPSYPLTFFMLMIAQGFGVVLLASEALACYHYLD
jgi:hypothetical protein